MGNGLQSSHGFVLHPAQLVVGFHTIIKNPPFQNKKHLFRVLAPLLDLISNPYTA
jgi:hypothetical protein